MHRSFVVGIALASLSSCNGSVFGLPGKTCTLRGCAGPGLTIVHVLDSQGREVTHFYGQATVEGLEQGEVIGCSGGTAYGDTDGSCADGLSVTRFIAGYDQRARFVVAVRDLATGEQFCGTPELTWTETEINGPGCGACQAASATVRLAAATSCFADLSQHACSSGIGVPFCTNKLRIEVRDANGTLLDPTGFEGTLTGEYARPLECDDVWNACDATGIELEPMADPALTYSLTVDAGDKGRFSGSVTPTFTQDTSAYAGCVWCGHGVVSVTLTPP